MGEKSIPPLDSPADGSARGGNAGTTAAGEAGVWKVWGGQRRLTPDRRAAAREGRRQPPGAYPCVERSRGGGTVTRYRTHMGQLCRQDTTPAEAVAMWDRRQGRMRAALTIGPAQASRLGAALTEAHRIEYEEMLAGQKCTVEMLRGWLKDRGYAVSVATIQGHRDHFLMSLLDVQHSARMAAAFTAAAREQSPAAIAEAAAGRTEQLFMEMLFQMKPEQRTAMTVKDWLDLQKASGGLVAGRRMMEQMRADFEDRARRAAEAAAQAAAKGKHGKPGVAIANRVREILGIPLLDDAGNEVADDVEGEARPG